MADTPTPNAMLWWNGEPCEAENVEVRRLMVEYPAGYATTYREYRRCYAIRVTQNGEKIYLSTDAWWWLRQQHPETAQCPWWQRLLGVNVKPRIYNNVDCEVKHFR